MTAYKTTPIFDQDSLPQALRNDHATKAGVWGLIRVIEGQLELAFDDGTATRMLTPERAGVVAPEQRHRVTPVGAMRMQVEFWDAEPKVN